jgi:hypothetical protein
MSKSKSVLAVDIETQGTRNRQDNSMCRKARFVKRKVDDFAPTIHNIRM